MTRLIHPAPWRCLGLTFALCAALLPSAWETNVFAYEFGKLTVRTDAPFAGVYGPTSLAASGMENLLTISTWADAGATVPAPMWQWFWSLGIDSGTGNGALLDGQESMTLQFDKAVGASMITFFYTGGDGGTGNGNLARLSISGFSGDPGAVSVPFYAPRISNISYAGGTLSFDYLNDGPGTDYGQLMLSNPSASAGATLKITGAASPNGNAPSWYAALYGVDILEGHGGPVLDPTRISHNLVNTYTTVDGALTVRGYSDTNAATPANLGRYQDECFGVYGGPGGNVVDTNESVTLQFASGIGLARLDSVYSGGTVVISGFVSDPGLIDPSASTSGASYANGSLTFNASNGGYFSLYFSSRAASVGQTLRINSVDHQFGIAGIGYVNSHTLLGPDIPSNVSPTYTTPDGLVTMRGYSDTPGTVPANLYENVNWFGVAGGGNNESTEGAESLNLQLAAGTGLAGLGTRYTSGQIVISGFLSDPGFSDPSGIATGVSYSAGTLTYTFNAPHAPEVVVGFGNPAASAGQTLSLHTDGSPGAQLTLTRINYSVTTAPVTLSIARSGNAVVLSWPAGTLQSSTNAEAFYSDVSGATSPYTNAVSGPQKFFRVRVQ